MVIGDMWHAERLDCIDSPPKKGDGHYTPPLIGNDTFYTDQLL